MQSLNVEKDGGVDEARPLAARLIADETSALKTLSREELGVDPEELGGSAWMAAGMSFVLFTIGAMLPRGSTQGPGRCSSG